MIDSNNIKAGILIPTFNRKAYLKESLRSAYEQSYNNIEILVVDNGSTDGTAEFMKSIGDERIRYVVNDRNIGLIGSINKGIRLLSDKVEWCTILCDDDLLDKDYVASMLNFITVNGVKTIVHAHRILINRDGNKDRETLQPPPIESAFSYIKNRCKRFKRETFLTGIFFSRNAFESIGGYPNFTSGMATDDAFIFALSIKDNLYFNKDAVALIRIHSGGESSERSNVIKHIYALDEFTNYVKNVASASNIYNSKQLEELQKALIKNVKRLNSNLWLRSIHVVASMKNNDQQLSELYNIVENKNYYFSGRILFDLFCVKTLNYSPEQNEFYRSFWDSLKWIYKMFRTIYIKTKSGIYICMK